MSLFSNLFGGKQKNEEEKQAYIDKLTPYKQYINNYPELIEKLSECELDVIKANVDKTIKTFDFENYLEDKYGKELGVKLCTEGVFLDMSEEQFNDLIRYQIITGKISGLYRGEGEERANPFFIRRENILKTKTKVVRSNSKKLKNPNRVDYIFENDKLVQVKKYK